nr:MAG TPA: hypothetical protein [Caudoviricetes sp.]
MSGWLNQVVAVIQYTDEGYLISRFITFFHQEKGLLPFRTKRSYHGNGIYYSKRTNHRKKYHTYFLGETSTELWGLASRKQGLY